MKLTQTKIFRSAHRNEILEWIRAGKPATWISRELIERYGEKINHISISKFRNQLLMKDREGLTYFDKQFRDIDAIFNDIVEYSKLILVQKERVSDGIVREKQESKLKPEVRKNVELYKQLLESFITIKQQLGLIPMPTETTVSVEARSDIEKKLDIARKKVLKQRQVIT